MSQEAGLKGGIVPLDRMKGISTNNTPADHWRGV